jgi:beta-phosphoglucomutase-like phosphatase (HAD superfamily)
MATAIANAAAMCRAGLTPQGCRRAATVPAARPQVMCMTNGSVEIATGVLQKAGVDDLVDAVMDVAQCSAWKPAAAAYRHAVESPGFGLQAHEVRPLCIWHCLMQKVMCASWDSDWL